MRNVPRVMLVGEPTFFTSVGDGPKPPRDELTYLSAAAPADVLGKTVDYFGSLGFSRLDSGEEPSSVVMQGRSGSLDISVRPGATGTCAVTISLTSD